MWQDAAIGLVFLQNNFDYIMSCVKMESINRNLWRDFLNFPYFTGFPAP